MDAVKEFSLWFFQQLPTLLMSEPLCYFVGLFFLGCIVAVVVRPLIGRR